MLLRRTFLRLSLVGTALTAAAAVFAIVTITGRNANLIFPAALLTAFLLALFFGSSFIVDKPALRPAILTGLSVATLAWALSITLIYTVSSSSSYEFSESLGSIVASLLAFGVPATIVMFFISFKILQVSVRYFLLFSCLSCLIVWTNIFLPSDNHNDLIFQTALLLYSSATAACFCLIGFQRPDKRPVRWLGVAAAALGFILGVIGFIAKDSAPALLPAVGIPEIIAALVAHWIILALIPLTPAQISMRYATFILGVLNSILASILCLRVLDDYRLFDDDLLFRTWAATTFITTAATLGLLILARLNRRNDIIPIPPLPASLTSLTLTCPNCNHTAPHSTGDSACAECGLRFSITLTEPRCAGCGYLLYNTPSPRCPECGLPVPTFAPLLPTATDPSSTNTLVSPPADPTPATIPTPCAPPPSPTN